MPVPEQMITCINSFNHEVSIDIVPTLPIGKQRPRKAKERAQGHPASRQ